jgi:phosphatidylglycerophosphate synthase
MQSARAGDMRPRREVRVRPRELEDPLNFYIYHPLASRLARLLVPTGIAPNAVSVTSGLLVVAGAFAYTHVAWPMGVLVGFTCHFLWHVVDGADGDLARMTGRASATGELVDGVCDYAGNVVMYFLFAFSLDDTIGLWAWVLTVGAGASHILQTNHAETHRRSYLWWAYGVPWLKTAAAAGGDDLFEKKSWFARYFSFFANGYIRLSGALSPGAAAIDAAFVAAAADPERIQRMRALVRDASPLSIRLEKALGANPKTLIIALAMALGSPAYYFVTVLVILNLVLAVSIRYHNRVNRALALRLPAA